MKRFEDILKNMDKTKWLILGLSGILLLVIALPVDGPGSSRKEAALEQSLAAAGTQKELAKTYEQQLVTQLEQTLRYMDGVGEVRVMVTFQDSGENVVEKDITKSQNEQNRIQYQESTVYQETDGKEPYSSRQKLPAVEGVLIIAQGGGNSLVKQEIQAAVMALFPIEAHKIKIVKMQTES